MKLENDTCVRILNPVSRITINFQKTVASPGRGILAMDESNATCGKRLASIGLENTEANRQAYRTLLVTAPGLGQYISGAILFEETLYQSTVDGKKIVDILVEQNIVPGIKVDKVRYAFFLINHFRQRECVIFQVFRIISDLLKSWMVIATGSSSSCWLKQ